MTLDKYLIHCDFELHPETEKESWSISALEKDALWGRGRGGFAGTKIIKPLKYKKSNYTLSFD